MKKKLLTRIPQLIIIIPLLLATVIITVAQTPPTNALNLRVRTDSTGYLIVSSGTYASPDSPLTAFGNIKLRTDANGYLIVTSGGGGGFLTAGSNALWTVSQTPNADNAITLGDASHGWLDVFISRDLYMQGSGGSIRFASGHILFRSTAAQVASGFNTTPTITFHNGTAVTIVGTGTSASTNTGVLTMPAATAGWACSANDLSDTVNVNQVATTTTTASFKAYNKTTGVAANWPASVSISIQCSGY